jgi:hypothetical protein
MDDGHEFTREGAVHQKLLTGMKARRKRTVRTERTPIVRAQDRLVNIHHARNTSMKNVHTSCGVPP